MYEFIGWVKESEALCTAGKQIQFCFIKEYYFIINSQKQNSKLKFKNNDS